MEHLDRLDGTNWVFRYGGSFPPGTDSFLLSAFPGLRRGQSVCDLGCGAGLLGLLLLRREPSLRVTGVELDRDACLLAEENARANGLSERLRFVGADLRKPEELPAPGSFDLAVCNPPYFPPDSGALSPQASRRAARAELTCSLDQVCAAAARLVRWGGRFAVVYRPERLTDLLNTMRQRGLEPKRLRFVQRTASSAPSLLLAEGRRGGGPGLRTEAPLLLEGPDGRPSAELDAIYWKGPVTTL